MALLLSRKLNEVIELRTADGIIKVWVVEHAGARMLIAVDAPASVKVYREEAKIRE